MAGPTQISQLGRIADALETIVEHLTADKQEAPETETVTVTTKASTDKPGKTQASKAQDRAAPSEGVEVKAADEPVTLDHVRAALMAKAERDGKEAAKAALSDFGVARVSELPEDKYQELVASIAA